MTVVGTAEILVHANTTPFVAEVEGKSRAALAEVEREAEVAGNRTGTAMAAGVRKGTTAMAAESRAAGATVGASLSQPIEHGAGRSSTAMVAAGAAGKKAFLGASLAIVGAAGEGIHLAESMQTTDAAIAGAAGTSVAAAKRVGDALLGTAGKSEFSGQVQAKAYAAVAGQLKAVQGRALDAAEAEDFMRAAGDLAIAKQIDLSSAVGATAAVLQGFGLEVKDAAHVTDVLFQASNASGISVDAMATQLARLHSKLGDTAGSLTDVAGLLVDMTERGITGRAAMAAVNSGLNTIQRTAGGVTNSVKAQNDAFNAMPPVLQRLVRAYQQGHISASELSKATKTLSPEQRQLVSTFNASTGAVDKARAKYKSLGVEVFDSHGKFVGMDRIIAQLAPKFAKMTQQQQLAAATTIFGAGAARQMTAVINAGTGAYEKATSTVGKHRAAESAAEKQGKTLHRELQTLGATVSDLATEFGQVLVPAATSVIHTVASVTHFFIENHGAAVALAAVIGGALSVAVSVFAVNKMGSMVRSVRAAGAELRLFAATSSKVASTVASKFGLQASAAEGSAAKIEASQAAERTAVTTTSTTVQAENAAAGRSFTMVGTNAGAGVATVEGRVAAEATAVGVADTAIETENAAAGASFLALLGPIGAVTAAVVALHAMKPGGDINSFIDEARRKVEAVQNRANAAITAPLTASAGVVGPPRHPNLSPVAHTNTSTHHASTTATSGLTASQREQLANLMADANAGGGGGGGGGSRTVNVTHAKSYTPTTFAEAVLQRIGAPVTAANVRGLVGWETAEGGHWHNPDKFNPFNTTLSKKGAHSTNSAGVKSYTSWKQGLDATVETLHGYGAILDVLKSGRGGAALANAVGSSPWGTSTAGVMAGIRSAHVGAIKHATKVASVDVTKWARSQIGHDRESRGNNRGPELDQLQRQFHTLGAAWCAEFATTAAMMGGAHKAVRTASTNIVVAEAKAGTHGYEKGLKKVGRSGDLVLLQGAEGFRQHIGFVESVNRARGTFTTIEGNTSAGKVARRVHQMSDAQGFARPDYPHGSALGYSASPTMSKDAKQFIAVTKMVDSQEKAFHQWLAGQRATESIMTAAQKKALNEEIAIKRSALGIQTTREYAALTTQTKQQAAHLKQESNDQKLGSAMTTKLVAAAHSSNLKQLDSVLKLVHGAGFDKLIKRLSHDHIDGFAQLRKQLVMAHKAALAQETKLHDAAVKAFLVAMDQAAAAAIGAQSQLDTDKNSAMVSAIQDQTKVTLDKQAEVGKTGADLVAAQAQTALDLITQRNDAAIAAAQIAVDQAAGGNETQKATAAANLAAAQGAAALQEAQAQSTLDIDNAAATAADAAQQAAESAAASTSLTETAITDARQFNFEINGGGMTAAELFGEVGWALKTGTLPPATAA